MPRIDPPYQTPDGFVDWPYVYVFNAAVLVDGTSPRNLSLQVQGDADFILRRITGLHTVGQALQYRNASQSNAFSAPARLGRNMGVVPEKLYPRNSLIGFDIDVVARAFIACGAQPVFTSFLAFQGVRRFPMRGAIDARLSNYRYYERPFDYVLNFTIDWRRFVAIPGATEPPRRFGLEVSNYDFELLYITVVNANGTQIAGVDFLMMLFDYGQHELSTLPLPLQNFNYVGPAGVTGPARFASVFPVPMILYPRSSQIEVAITSMICNTDLVFPRAYQMVFHGVERVPC